MARRFRFRFRFLPALLALTLFLCGCAMMEEAPAAAPSSSPSPSAAPSPSPAPPADPVVAIVGGEPIYRSDFEPMFAFYYDYSTRYEDADYSSENVLAMFQDDMLDMAIQEKVLNQRAAMSGVTLNEEERAEAEKALRAIYEPMLDEYRNQAAAAGAADVEAEALALFAEALAPAGLTPEGYREKFWTLIEERMLREKLRESIYASVTLTEAEAREQFKTDVVEAREYYRRYPEDFYSAQDSYDLLGGLPPLYTPEGFRRVKWICIDITDERPEAEALALAREIYDRAAAGEDFDALMAEYGESIASNDTWLIYEDRGFGGTVQKAAMALRHAGELSEPVKTDRDVYLLQLESILESGEKTFEEVREPYMESLLVRWQIARYRSLLAEWSEAANIIRYPEHYRDLGKTEALQ